MLTNRIAPFEFVFLAALVVQDKSLIVHLLFSDDTYILKISREDLADQTVTMTINK
jgi:hypothetical protein